MVLFTSVMGQSELSESRRGQAPVFAESAIIFPWRTSIDSLTCHILELKHLLVILFLHQVYQDS